MICTKDPWLLVFDHASDFRLVQHVWSSSNPVGSILLTSWCNSRSGQCLITKVPNYCCRGRASGASPSNTLQAAKIQVLLGGLPLALDQIGNYISYRKLTFQRFVKIWETDADTVACWIVDKTSIDRTLSFIWSHSLIHLRRDARALSNLICYLKPERIEESVLYQNPSLEDYMSNLLSDPIRYA
jgi:hypothetical protein